MTAVLWWQQFYIATIRFILCTPFDISVKKGSVVQPYLEKLILKVGLRHFIDKFIVLRKLLRKNNKLRGFEGRTTKLRH